MCDVQFDVKHKSNENMAERYPKRKLSTEEISRALNFESDSDDSNDKLFVEQSLMKCLI